MSYNKLLKKPAWDILQWAEARLRLTKSVIIFKFILCFYWKSLSYRRRKWSQAANAASVSSLLPVWLFHCQHVNFFSSLLRSLFLTCIWLLRTCETSACANAGRRPVSRVHLIKKKLSIDFFPLSLIAFLSHRISFARRVTFALRWEFNWILPPFFPLFDFFPLPRDFFLPFNGCRYGAHTTHIYLKSLDELLTTMSIVVRSNSMFIGSFVHSLSSNYKLISIGKESMKFNFAFLVTCSIQFPHYPFLSSAVLFVGTRWHTKNCWLRKF